MTTKLKNTLLAFSESLRKGQTILCSKKDKDLADEIEEMLKGPKHDPCRLFKKGDKVRVVTYKGRNKTGVSTGEIGVIDKDEKAADVSVEVIFYGDDLWEIDPAYLELVTPVEELEPYYVRTNIDCSTCTIFKRVGEKELVHSAYYFMHGKGCSNAILGINEANAAAEAECARLNAEYRKEHQ